MILGTKTRYAVMAMADLAGRGKDHPVTLAEIAGAQEIPLAYLEQIFAKLKRAGLVQSAKGPGGGYRLLHEPRDVAIASIVTAVQESLKMTRCEKESHTGCMASKAQCATHELWEGLGSHIVAYLEAVSLADICVRTPAALAIPQPDAPPAT